jgi:restriction system protein
MAEITSKRRGEILRGIFKILMSEPNGMRAKEILQKLEIEIPPTEYEQGTYEKSNVQKI